MSVFPSRPPRIAAAGLALILPLLMDACSSSSRKKGPGAPSNLPAIDLHGASATPSHSMPRDEYPFDAGGNYVSTWAQEGESKAGRGAATSSDYAEWRSSHHKDGGRSSSSKKKSSGSSSKSKSKKSPAPVKKTAASKKHVVKSGDTLSSIARKYGTSVSKLKAANGLKSDVIRDGRSLSIPK